MDPCPKYCEAVMFKVIGSCVSGMIYIDVTCISVGTNVLHCGDPWILYLNTASGSIASNKHELVCSK